MGKTRVHELTTVDGSVGVPEWTMDHPFTNEQTAETGGLTQDAAAILLGRTTYEMFTPAWSQRTVEDDPGAPFFDDTRKHVVSSTLDDPSWGPVTVLSYDAARLQCSASASERSSSGGGGSPPHGTELEDEVDGDLHISGSGTLVRSMLADGVVDELYLFVHPVALGESPYLVPQGSERTPLTLLGSTVYENGVVLTYGPATSVTG